MSNDNSASHIFSLNRQISNHIIQMLRIGIEPISPGS